MGRRAALGALAAAGLGGLAWAYSPRSKAGVPRGRIGLEYWEKWTGLEAEALQRVVDRYNGSQDRVWVTLTPVSDITAKAMVAIGGGDPPDLVGLYTYSVPGFAEARAVMPLEEFEALGAIDPGRYLPGVRSLLMHEGRLWAGVNTCYTLGLYYNRGLMREAGLNPARPPRMVSELDEMGGRLTRKGPEGRIEVAGFLQNIPAGWWPYYWPTVFDGMLYDAASDRATAAEERCVAAFQWIARTASRHGIADSRAFAASFSGTIHSAQDPFISGRLAMIVQGPWMANFIRALRPELDYGCAPVPVADGVADPGVPRGMLEADVLAIPRGCPHPEEAYQFLLYMQGQDVQEELAAAHCKPSPLLETSPGFMERHPNPWVGVHDAIARSPAVQVLPRTRVWKQYADLIVSAFDAVWSGAEPRAELMRVQARGQELIDLAAARRRQRAAVDA